MILKEKFKRHLPLFILVLAVLVMPLFLTGGYLCSVMSMMGIYTILAVGMCLIMGYSKQFSLAHPAFFGLGAYMSAILVVNHSWPPLAALVVAALVTGLMAYGIGKPLFRLGGYYLACATFCVLIVFQNCMIQLRNVTGGAQGVRGIPYFSLYGFVLNDYVKNFYFIWFLVIICMILTLNIANSKIGRAIRAISTSEAAGETCGIHVAKYKVNIFTYSAILASIAGSIYAHYLSFISPDTFGFEILLDLLVMIVIGGIDSVWGGLIGAIIFVSLGETLRELLASSGGEIIMIIWGIIVIVMLKFIPGGIVRAAERIGKLRALRFKARGSGFNE